MSIPHSLGRRGLAVSVSTAVALASHGRTLLGDNGSDLSSGTRVAYILVSVALVIIAGIAAGLTLGLLSLDRCAFRACRS